MNDQFDRAGYSKGVLRFCLAIAFFVGAAVTASAQTQVEVDVLVQRGRQQLLEARKAGTDEAYQKAETTFTEALQIDQTNIPALTYRGLTILDRSALMAKQGRFDVSGMLTNKAVADLNRAVSLSPNDYHARLARGSTYAQFPPFLNKGPTAIEDLEVVTKHPQFASQSAEARARVQLTLGSVYAAAGQTEKAKQALVAAVTVSPQSPSGIAAQQELEKLAKTPAAIDSQGRRRPDHFPQISDETSPVIVAATVTLPTNASIQNRSSLPPSMQRFLSQLDSNPDSWERTC